MRTRQFDHAPVWHHILPVLALTTAACSETPIAGVDGSLRHADAVKFWESNAAVYWNGVARGMVVSHGSPAPFAIRGYAIVSVAQYNAAVAAESGKAGNVHPSGRAAIAGASAVALSYLYPGQASALEDLLETFLSLTAWPGERNTNAAAGVSGAPQASSRAARAIASASPASAAARDCAVLRLSTTMPVVFVTMAASVSAPIPRTSMMTRTETTADPSSRSTRDLSIMASM